VTLSVKPLCLAAALASALPALPARAADLNPRLEPLKPLLKTWRGAFPESTPEKPVVDVSRFEAALNGQAVRNTHSINDGVYGGETFIVWDQAKQALVYYYFTTGGFYTSGTMRAEEGALVAHETVMGAAGGVTEVKATFRLLPDGRLHVRSQHLKDGKWSDSRDMHYTEAPGATVRFKD
jgi:hypothetical protein